MRKALTLLLTTVLVLSSLAMTGSVFAQSPPEPSVPEFTVKFVNASYTVTTTNSYTGVNETEQVSNNSVKITITNQPFSHQDHQIYYNVRVKPRFEENWTEVYPVKKRPSEHLGDGVFSYAQYIHDDSPLQSESGYTIITFYVVPTGFYDASGYDFRMYYWGAPGQESRYSTLFRAIPDDSQLDFQVEVLVGHSSQRWVIDHPLYPEIGGHFEPAVAYDTSSGWSNTQTVTIGEEQTPTPEPTSTPVATPELTSTPYQEPQQIEQELIIGMAIAVAVVSAGLGLLIYLIKRK